MSPKRRPQDKFAGVVTGYSVITEGGVYERPTYSGAKRLLREMTDRGIVAVIRPYHRRKIQNGKR